MAIIEPPGPDDREQWSNLYRGYAVFYEMPMPDETLETVWGWIHDPGHEVNAFVAREESRLVGLTHYRPFARPLRGAMGLFLDDLFVDPAARGGRIGSGLIDAVAGVARERGFNLVRWITADDNYRARTSYDRLATRTHWITYDMAVSAD